jgi:cytochrome P450
VIDLILDANQPTADSDYRMDDITVRDNLLSFLAAGTETTATSITWTLHYLALHPDVGRATPL